jgi:hypothetical protein
MLALRIALGILIFLILAILDYRKNGPRATRWREYRFLLITVAAAMMYGILNDQITSRISWEYFYYGKKLADVLPAEPMPHPRLYWEAVKIGAQATWTAGLIIGVVLLFANNPTKRWPQLSQAQLLRMLLVIFAITIACAALLGLAGYTGKLAIVSEDFAQMIRKNEMRPHRFLAVFGIHLGGYAGGLIGLLVTIPWILIKRRACAAWLQKHSGQSEPARQTSALER